MHFVTQQGRTIICRENSSILITLLEMALETSIWLNKCFIEKILRKSENDNSIQVIDVFSKPATMKGDNYLSDMIRIIVDFSRSSMIKEKKSIIIKISPVLESIRQKLVINLMCIIFLI